MLRTILHIDFDSFFASCEQHFNPNLRGKPIGITAANGRNAVIAASREAKRRGVKSPGNTWDAKRACPEIEFVKADFERYLEITKKLLQIANHYSPIVELFSLDEVFIDLTPVMNLYPPRLARSSGEAGHSQEFLGALWVAEDFKKILKEEVGPTITVSIGISTNKLVAKLATKLNKPDGTGMIDHTNKKKVFANLELTDIMGIGHGYERRLNMMGIFTFKQLEECPMYLLKAEFGNVASQNLKALSLGMDDTPVVSYLEDIETKSVGRNYCLPQNEYNKEKVLKNIYELCEEIAIKLRRLKMRSRTIGLFLRGNESYGQRKTIVNYTNLGKDIFAVCSTLYNNWNPEYVRQISIYSSNLIEEQYTTIPLFESPKKEVVIRLIDQINDRFGHHTLRRGYLTDAPQLHTQPNGFMADRWQREELRSV